jgi:hypothetical protein
MSDIIDVTTTDDSLVVYQTRDLTSTLIVQLPKGHNFGVGAAEEHGGREWMQATLVDGRIGYVLGPSARSHTTLGSMYRRCVQCGNEIKSAAMKCRFCGYILDAELRRELNSEEIPSHAVKYVESQANKALWCGILGLVICAPVLGSMAISSGNDAIATLAQYPHYAGPRGKAQAGRIMGWVDWAFFVIGVLGYIARSLNTVPK